MQPSQMNKIIIPSALILALTGCGGGGETTRTSTDNNTRTVLANISKGPVDGASCELYSITENGDTGTLLASATSTQGVASFENVSHTGNTLVTCNGGTYTDEATGMTMTAPQMRAVLTIATDTEISVTPLTEMAVNAAGVNLNNVDNDSIATAFGLENVDITQTAPTDINTTTAGDDGAGNYGTVLGIISQYQSDQAQNLAVVMENLSQELEDGRFSSTTQTQLSSASTSLLTSNVSTNLNESSVSQLVETISSNTDTTPPEVGFSPSSLIMEYSSTSSAELTIVDGSLLSDVTCDEGISFTNNTATSTSSLGDFTCSATGIDNDQNVASATLTVTVVDTTAPVITAPTSVTFVMGEAGVSSISAVDEISGTLGISMSCSSDVFWEGAFYSQTPGSYSCTASASDENGNTATTEIAITVTSTSVNAPVANAGSNFSAPTGSYVTLDGSGSSDLDQDTLTYTWEITSKPTTSSATVANASSEMTYFTPDVDGDYTFTLTVNDGLYSDSSTLTVTAATQSWVINNTDSSANFGVLVNVQSVSSTSIGPNQFNQISATGIPDYQVEMTQAQIDTLNNRPEAATDFDNGQTSAQVGQIVSFGDDIGYNIIHAGCSLGYWPPGPACPSDQSRSANIPANPTPASTDCETSVNAMGLMLNGTSIYNWSDGVSYNQQGVWNQLAPEFEIYDVDICSGHAQTEGDYHHHMFSPCLANLFGDEGQAHSPIYGYAADGYPVYGPYYAKGELAKSAWVKRDYSDLSKGGCSDGQRSCLLVDQYDLSQGTQVASSSGPDTTEVVTSNSGNQFTAEVGYYFEDYYYDASLTAQGGAYLDEHNGHDHDNLGYHYHTTVEADGSGNLVPVFPYNIGPTFYGDTPGGSVYTCNPMP